MTAQTARKPLSAKKQAKRDAARKAAYEAVTEAAALEIDVDEDDHLARAFASLTEHYSENNAVLILQQAMMLGLKVRGLSDVGGYNAFLQRGRQIKEDQKYNRLIYVWARVKPADTGDADREETTVDPATGRKTRARFRLMSIYHVSQTEPRTVPDDPGTDAARSAEQAAAVDADRRTGETREQALRRAYEEETAARYVQAETDTRGHMLNPAGLAKGVDARALFSGRADTAARYASEELADWWQANGGRVTFTQYRANHR